MSSESSVLGERKDTAAKPFDYLTVEPADGDPAVWNGAAGGRRASSKGEEEARQKGFAEGLAQARAEFEKSVASLRAQISCVLKEFSSQREAYFERVEPEVVHLSLAIARKILHRESQLDPLLLTAIVRVALDKISANTKVRLRSNPSEAASWQQYFAQSPASDAAVEVLADPALQGGECVLETDLGSTQVSLEIQLKEIEQGLLDLLEQRPKVR